MWDSHTLQCLRTLEGHEDNVRVLAVGEHFLYSGSWDKSIRCVLGFCSNSVVNLVKDEGLSDIFSREYGLRTSPLRRATALAGACRALRKAGETGEFG